jgi:hypothetical protein
MINRSSRAAKAAMEDEAGDGHSVTKPQRKIQNFEKIEEILRQSPGLCDAVAISSSTLSNDEQADQTTRQP